MQAPTTEQVVEMMQRIYRSRGYGYETTIEERPAQLRAWAVLRATDYWFSHIRQDGSLIEPDYVALLDSCETSQKETRPLHIPRKETRPSGAKAEATQPRLTLKAKAEVIRKPPEPQDGSN